LSGYISNYQERTKELLSKLNELKSEVESIEKEMSKRQMEINSTVEKMTKTTTLIPNSEMVQLNIGDHYIEYINWRKGYIL
jgi:peptidoglycan hydrolase CwlO-like protein